MLKSNFMKSVQREPSYSIRTNGRAGRRTGMTKPIVDFRNFAIAPKHNKKQRALAVAHHNPGGRSSETVQCRIV